MVIAVVALVFGVMALAVGPCVPASAAESAPQIAQPATDLSGLHDFYFLAGEWRTHHRRLKERLVSSHEWVEFDGTLNTRLLMGNYNVRNRRGEVEAAFALGAVEDRRGVERLAFDTIQDLHSRHGRLLAPLESGVAQP